MRHDTYIIIKIGAGIYNIIHGQRECGWLRGLMRRYFKKPTLPRAHGRSHFRSFVFAPSKFRLSFLNVRRHVYGQLARISSPRRFKTDECNTVCQALDLSGTASCECLCMCVGAISYYISAGAKQINIIQR